ncbi:DNA repair RAD52-like protein 1, mitochondrial [Iris pallida]|uniref:DNA repair RAD52-like protein 1, mitochondrial n=1 Tax=Iris pallida TaxID=29817 RepID=A0AAX6I7I7_IRIPA|nr:DNA repair RAD52-like protein 1, mitochondrial [Iris pallida]
MATPITKLFLSKLSLLRSPSPCQKITLMPLASRSSATRSLSSSSPKPREAPRLPLAREPEDEQEDDAGGIHTKPLSEILKALAKKVPDSFIKTRVEDGFTMKYVPWHIVNRILNSQAPEWSGEVTSIVYSADGKSVTVVYRVTLYGTDAEIYRESTGTASVDDTSYGDPVQKAEAMAFRRACARLGLGLHLYHEDAL